MRIEWSFAALVAAAALSGCGRDTTQTCEVNDRYTTAKTAAPVRIPDDLSPPDEADSLRLPPESVASAAAARTETCIESPPKFGSGVATRGRGAAAARPAADAPASAPAAPPAEPSRSPAGGDRDINN